MKQIIKITAILVTLLSISCKKIIIDEPSDSVRNVFETFWKTIDEKYTYFDLKQINWNEVYDSCSLKLADNMTDEELFNLLSSMVGVLKDGHSGITSPFNMYKYHGFYEHSPENFNGRLLQDNYTPETYYQTNSLKHFIISGDDIAYIRYTDFTLPLTDAELNYVFEKYTDTKGLILDIRNNFGGDIANVYSLAGHFCQEKTLIFRTMNKNGKAHNDLTPATDCYLSPSKNPYSKTVCVLTNRKCFSATSFFVLAMKQLPNVLVVGDTTGGGLGLPVGYELSNGWQIHCAGSMTLSSDGENFELGIPPDIQVDMNKDDEAKGIDSIVEGAIKIILSHTSG